MQNIENFYSAEMKPDKRHTKRKLATAREKRRMEKLNLCIEDLRQMICPSMKGLNCE